MSARANAVLPAPRSPESVTRSPGMSEFARSIASRRVACSSGSATEKLDVPEVVSSIAMESRRRALRPLVDREYAGHGGAAADRRFQRHRAAVQLDEGAHQRQAEAGAAVPRAERVRLEPIEYPVLHIGRDARPAIGHR